MNYNPTLIIDIKPSEDFKNRIATLEKNRGNDLTIEYNIFNKSLVQPKPEIEEITITI